MNTRTGPTLAIVVAAIVAVLVLGSQPGSEGFAQSDRASDNRLTSDSLLGIHMANAERRRVDLLALFDKIEDLGMLQQQEAVWKMAASGRRAVEQMTHEELHLLAVADAYFPDLAEALDLARAELAAAVAEPGRRAVPLGGPDSSFPDAEFAVVCPAVIPTDAVFGVQLSLDVVKLVQAAVSRACDQVVAGFSASLACIAVDIAVVAIEAVINGFEVCLGDYDTAHIEAIYGRVAYLRDQLEQVLSQGDTIIDELADFRAEVNQRFDFVDLRIDQVEASLLTRIQELDDMIQQRLDYLEERVEEVRLANCEIIRLLHTPQGQRTSDIFVCEDHREFPFSW